MPLAPILIVSGDEVVFSEPASQQIGLKAFGLCSLPIVWTKPFFVISGKITPTQKALDSAFLRMGMEGCKNIIVRSSGVDESIDDRGSLDSESCLQIDVLSVINDLKETVPKNVGLVHWVVQDCIPTKIKGHLSNEKRVSEAARDWIVEYEVSENNDNKIIPISLRNWRDSRKSKIEALSCLYKDSITDILSNVAKWTFEQKLRIHYEWVWCGEKIYIVQADDANTDKVGDNPQDLVKISLNNDWSDSLASDLIYFKLAEDEHYLRYRKLENSKIYRAIGYTGYQFYVLNSQCVFRDLLSTDNIISDGLLSDLGILTRRPLILRTDGVGLAKDKLRMLPRSDELRSLSDAKDWLENSFRKKIIENGLADADLCLIAHHFIPAISAAWSQASPDKRMVRIESLWGLPEGINYYSHDVFDVDTGNKEIPNDFLPDDFVNIFSAKKRFKDHFIAPSSDGSWSAHHTDEKHSWARSIKSESWIKEIAWSSRRIAQEANKKLVIMWFVGIPKEVLSYPLLPWYHEEDATAGMDIPTKAPARNILTHEKFLLKTEDDWNRIKKSCENGEAIDFVRMQPVEPELVRNQKFAKDIADYSRKYNFIILLSGGLLSHAFYVIRDRGGNFQCEDLYTTSSENIDFNKLVRDKVPQKIQDHGELVNLLHLKGKALEALTKRKIIEECFEVKMAETLDDIAEEIADVKEAIESLCKHLDIDRYLPDEYYPMRHFDNTTENILISSCESPLKGKVSFSFPVYLNQQKIKKVIAFDTLSGQRKIFCLNISVEAVDSVVKILLEVRETVSEVEEKASKQTEMTLVDHLKNFILISAYEILDTSDSDRLKSEINEISITIDRLAAVLGIEAQDILKIKEKKINKAGGFERGLMLVETHLKPLSLSKHDPEKIVLFSDYNDMYDPEELPSYLNKISPDKRKKDNESDIYQFDISISTYNVKPFESPKRFNIGDSVTCSIDIHRDATNILCDVTFETVEFDYSFEQMKLI